MRSIRGGDVIEFYPRAFYPGWVNIVAEAEICIRYRQSLANLNTLSPINTTDERSRALLYKPLNPACEEIRLLEIDPGDFDSTINCSLIHTNLSGSERQPFEALSYCWGSSPTRCSIQLMLKYPNTPGTSIAYRSNVTLSAYRAIRQFRLQTTKRVMWIDAVCINQDDRAERSQQVSLMPRIYSSATQVNVWPGNDRPGTEYALTLVREIYNSQHSICPGSIDCHCELTPHKRTISRQGNPEGLIEVMTDIRDSQWTRAQLQSQDLPSEWMQFFPHPMIDALFGNPWFRRVWVLQEVLRSRKTIVHSGSERVPWHEIIEFNHYLKTFWYLDHSAPQAMMPSAWTILDTACRGDRHQAASPAIIDVLLHASELEATDPRDKIWALLAFATETSFDAHHKIPSLIRPDYAKATCEVYVDFTRWWILKYKSLSILSAIHGQAGRSWQSLHCPRNPVPICSSPSWAIGPHGSLRSAEATLLISADLV